ncbi:MAG: LysR family transcriptional regulator [Streptomycetaceae bacterium]|nr:LysR family transcriptional regulator [Streptomycetaceae bacterium]
MDFKQLKALMTVAETGSVTRAAELLELVQPAVTRQIRMLEAELGVTLFERSSRGMRLTEAGEIMVDRSRRIFDDLKYAQMAVQPHPHNLTGTVTLGLLESTADLLAAPVAAAVRRDHPGIDLRLTTAYSGHLQQWLDNGTLDLSVLHSTGTTPTLHSHPLVRDNLWVVAPPGAGLRPDTPVPFADAVRHPLVLPTPGHALRVLVDRAAAQADVTVNTFVATDSLRMQRQLVRAGLGWGILPGVALADDLAQRTLSAAPLCDPDIWRSIALVTRRATPTPQSVRAVARAVTRQAKAAARDGAWPLRTEPSPQPPQPRHQHQLERDRPASPVRL